MADQKTNLKILRAARNLLTDGGFGAVSFDAIARVLGVSKQAVLYWYPSKQDLLAAMFVDWLSAEADVAATALEDTHDPHEAIAAFIGAIAQFHLDDLNRFRMMYLAPQTLRTSVQEPQDAARLDEVHETTDRLYSALADRLPGDRRQARQQAFVIHSSVLGLSLMFGLAEGTGDPLKHSQDELVTALAARLSSS